MPWLQDRQISRAVDFLLLPGPSSTNDGRTGGKVNSIKVLAGGKSTKVYSVDMHPNPHDWRCTIIDPNLTNEHDDKPATRSSIAFPGAIEFGAFSTSTTPPKQLGILEAIKRYPRNDLDRTDGDADIKFFEHTLTDGDSARVMGYLQKNSSGELTLSPVEEEQTILPTGMGVSLLYYLGFIPAAVFPPAIYGLILGKIDEARRPFCVDAPSFRPMAMSLKQRISKIVSVSSDIRRASNAGGSVMQIPSAPSAAALPTSSVDAQESATSIKAGDSRRGSGRRLNRGSQNNPRTPEHLKPAPENHSEHEQECTLGVGKQADRFQQWIGSYKSLVRKSFGFWLVGTIVLSLLLEEQMILILSISGGVYAVWLIFAVALFAQEKRPEVIQQRNDKNKYKKQKRK
eukprot:GHVT01088615.1.p1 GENE.GHVT01088615.1~~GHVT01088615.1.p1  ORF type:complete len:400 (+),score=51.91 GHVT01088615.1:900-2099(+)